MFEEASKHWSSSPITYQVTLNMQFRSLSFPPPTHPGPLRACVACAACEGTSNPVGAQSISAPSGRGPSGNRPFKRVLDVTDVYQSGDAHIRARWLF